MTDTTVRLKETTKERLDNYRHHSHDNISQTLGALMDYVPKPVDIISDGCANCGKTPPEPDAPIDEIPGVIQHFVATQAADELVTGTNYYCSVDCAAEMMEQANEQVPREPDTIHVGGKDEFAATIPGGRMHLTGDEFSVGFSIPGAFDSNEYDYVGEPVYIENSGDIVQEGVIEDIIHEEGHTTLLLEHDLATTRLNHPDGDEREDYLSEWRVGTHTPCGGRVQTRRGDNNDVGSCPHCGDSLDSETFDEHPISVKYGEQ